MTNVTTITVYAKAYVKYDCDTERVYVFVADEEGGGLLLIDEPGFPKMTHASINIIDTYTGFSSYDGIPPTSCGMNFIPRATNPRSH